MTASRVRTAIAALRAGRPVSVTGVEPMTILAVETATPEILGLLDPDGNASLLISGHRAAALGLGNRREAADPGSPVTIERAHWLDPAAALALADPGQDFDRAPLGPLVPNITALIEQSGAALRLSRSAGLLPALWLIEDQSVAAEVSPKDVADAVRAPEMTLAARAKLPLEGLPETQILAFRAGDDGDDHVALVIGAFGGKAPLVRLHSQCLTGDVFGSLKCDCGPQLREALKLIADEGGGVLLYLPQEGRGIGLVNKLRAYALQDRGLDTVDSNLRLGFADEEREYVHAAAMLRKLGIGEVRLLTNNPAKVAGLVSAGIDVAERMAHHMPANAHNADYLATKQRRSGHLT